MNISTTQSFLVYEQQCTQLSLVTHPNRKKSGYACSDMFMHLQVKPYMDLYIYQSNISLAMSEKTSQLCVVYKFQHYASFCTKTGAKTRKR